MNVRNNCGRIGCQSVSKPRRTHREIWESFNAKLLELHSLAGKKALLPPIEVLEHWERNGLNVADILALRRRDLVAEAYFLFGQAVKEELELEMAHYLSRFGLN